MRRLFMTHLPPDLRGSATSQTGGSRIGRRPLAWLPARLLAVILLAASRASGTVAAQQTGTITGRVVDAQGGGPFQIRMSREAIELATLLVEVLSDEERQLRSQDASSDVIARAALADGARQGLGLDDLLRREVPGIRVRDSCVEYRFVGLPDDCRQMAVYLNGMRVQESAVLFSSIALQDLERVEVHSPGEAGVRYGDAGFGVLLLESRRATALMPEGEGAVTLTGFGWSEARPYRWARVLGGSVAGNAAAATLLYATLLGCGEEAEFELVKSSQCRAGLSVGAGVLTGTVGGLLASWAGESDLSRQLRFIAGQRLGEVP